MADAYLDKFLKLAGIQPGARELYFDGCALGPRWTIAVPDADRLAVIERRFGDVLRACRPVTLLVLATPRPKDLAPAYLNAQGKAAWALKKATQPRLEDPS